ncbi:MAG: hypothetical protein ABTD50_23025 [Polyangiaceae bacterium]
MPVSIVGLQRAEPADLVGQRQDVLPPKASGSTGSTKKAAVFTMRIPVQLGQMLRPPHEKMTREGRGSTCRVGASEAPRLKSWHAS